jgi:hypothetical protein
MATPVLVSVNTDETKYEEARIAFRDTRCWLVVGASWKASGLIEFAQMPEVHCPIVDLSNVPDDQMLQHLMSKHIGATNLEELLNFLLGLGATVSYQHCRAI